MKKVLIQCLHRPNRSPSQRFRFEQYLPYLEQHGYQFEFSYLLNEEEDIIFYRPGHYFRKLLIVLKSIRIRSKELINHRQYDLLFVQREGFMLGTAFFEKAMASKIPMIFDFDDAIWMPVVSEGNKKLAFLKNAEKTKELIKAARMVFAGNEYLASYARQFNPSVEVIPTTLHINKTIIKQQNDKNTVCIGWSGSFSTIQHFELAIPVLKRIKEKYVERVHFTLMGDGKYRNPELGIEGIAWSAEKELEVLQTMDIGIMPLPDDEWSKGKCGFKGLLYMSLGIPAVMSPVGVNKEIIQHGANGFLPATENDWFNCLSQLIESSALRKKIGENGFLTVKEKYANGAWEKKYLNFFDMQIISKGKFK